MNDLLETFNFIGLDLGKGKRNVDLQKELEKANKNKISERIPETVLELGKEKGLSDAGALARYGTYDLRPVLPAGLENAEIDPKTGRLVGKDRPTGILGGLASAVDVLGLTDLDKKGGGILGRQAERGTGLGGRPEDFYLSQAQKDAYKESITPASTSALPDPEEQLDFLEKNFDRINKLNRNLKRQASFDEAANYALTEPIRQRFLRDAVTFKQKQLLEAERIKQQMPNAVQSRLALADAGFATQAGAIAGQQDAATRFAGLGMQRPFGQPTFRVS